MRTIVAVCAMSLLGVTAVGAAQVEGKWGLGAGVFPGGLSVSLIRGTSERSAWLFDVAIEQRDRTQDRQSPPDPLFHVDQDTWLVRVGPGYRRFLRPDEKFSPYWDVEVNGLYSRSHSSLRQEPITLSGTQTSTGVAGEFAFGLEYFFRQNLSVAAHGTVAEVAWLHTSRGDRGQGSFIPPSFQLSTSGHVVTSSIGLNPVIFLRGYW